MCGLISSENVQHCRENGCSYLRLWEDQPVSEEDKQPSFGCAPKCIYMSEFKETLDLPLSLKVIQEAYPNIPEHCPEGLGEKPINY